MKVFRFLLIMLMLIASAALTVRAQTYQGRILGTVTDQSGGVVVGAKITVTSTATGIARTLQTNSAGDYLAADLEPGPYIVSVEATGFKISVSDAVTLEVGRDIRVNLSVQPGDVTQTVHVTAEDTLVDTTNGTLNGVLSNKAINDLPLQGRDFQNLLPLHPGVQRTPGGGFQSITSNGNRPDENNFYIDGATDNDVYYGESVVNEAGIAGTPASFLPLDAIQEFNTQEDPTAEYGFKPGVVMNLGLKSGTNDFHGTAYYFHRNSAFDARNFYNLEGEPFSALLMHQFGASLGGPIKKDKWFFFVNYEGIRDKVGNPGVYDSPVQRSLASELGGIENSSTYSIADAVTYCTSGLFSTGCTPNPLSMKLLGLLLPNPGFTLSQSDPAAIDLDFNNQNRGDNFVIKSDYHLSDHHMLSARWFYSNTDQIEVDTVPLLPIWRSTTAPTTQVFGLDWTWTPNSSWVNDARFSFDSFNEAIFPLDHSVNPLTYGLKTGVTNPQLFGMPRINPGTDAFNYMGGNSGWPLETTPSATYSWSDTVSLTTGKNTLRFGGEYRWGTVNYFRATEGRGRVDFSDLTDFVGTPTDDPDIRRWEFLYGNPKGDLSMKSFGFFAQDSYRLTPRLTLNLGLRWDVTFPIQDANDKLANFLPSAGIVQVGHGISQPYDTNWGDVSPRFGFAWDIFGTGKTILRGSGGIIYIQPSIRTFLFSGGGLNLNPTTAALGVTPGNGTINAFLQDSTDGSVIHWNLPQNLPAGENIFPGSSASGSSCSIDIQCFIFAVNPKLGTPYVEQWNLNVQQSLSRNTLLQVAYVGNKGVNLYSITDPNQVNQFSPAESPANCDHCESLGRPFTANCPVAQGGEGLGGPCFPYIGFMQLLANQAKSIYHSGQVTLTHNFSHGLYLLAGYTYAHAIDTSTSNTAGVPQNSLDYQAERGNSDFDIRHRFTLSVAYEIPGRRAPLQLLKGWQVTSIVTLEGGEPYTLGDFSDDISLTGEFDDRWDISGNPGHIHWSPSTPIPYVDPSEFTSDAAGNVTGGANAAAQACYKAALAAGGRAAANQLNGNPIFENEAGFPSTSGGCYVQGGTILTPPAPLQFGNMGRNIFRGPGLKEWDFSLTKNFSLTERLRLQLRGEFFNVLNHPNFDVFTMNTDLSEPGNVGTPDFTPDLAASNPVLGNGGSRHIQIGAKFIF